MKTIGHHAVKRRFEQTLQRGRLASTFLFTGPEGVGKRTFALDLAKALLCKNPTGLSACGDCESCRLMAAGGHPDLQSVGLPAGKSTLPLELFVGRADHRNREGLCHEIALKPYLAGRRIAIINDADKLSIESANCLLKTLEEPPPRSVVILIGTSLSKQLPTIRSRCQTVQFDGLSAAEVEEVLRIEGLAEEGSDPRQMAAEAQGSVSRALAAGDESLKAFRSQVASTISQPNFDPVGLSAAVLEEIQAGGAEPAVKRERLRAIIGFAIENDRQTIREVASSGGVDDRLLRRLESSLFAAEAVERNANHATLVQAWLMDLSDYGGRLLDGAAARP